MDQNIFYAAACAYVARGWYVFPCYPQQKNPIPINGMLSATQDLDQIRVWWERWPDANIAIATDPSGIVVLDVDVSGDKQGAVSHGEIVDRLPPTLSATTRSNGAHFFFAHPGDRVNYRKINLRPEGVTASKSGLDLIYRGYVLVAPSVVVDKVTGAVGYYSWDNDADPEPIAPLPELLRAAIQVPDLAAPKNAAGEDLITEPGRNDALFRLACRLRGAGLGADELSEAIHAINARRVEPPLSHREVTTIVGSAVKTAEYNTAGKDQAIADYFAAATHAEPPADTDDAGQTNDALDQLLAHRVAAQVVPPIEVHATQFDELNRLLGGGLATRQLTVIMGGPGAGKTAAALSLAAHMALWRPDSQPAPALYVSTEIERHELACRLAAPIVKRAWRDLVRDGTAETRAKVVGALQRHLIYLLGPDEIPRDLDKALLLIQSTAHALAARHGRAPTVFVDYLQNMARHCNEGERRQRVGQAAEDLRTISQAVPCVMVAVAAVSRAGYGSALEAVREADDPEGYLALAKESGDIEYSAAVVLFLDVVNTGGDHKRGNIVVPKARHGEQGQAGIKFFPALGYYESTTTQSTAGSRDTREIDDTKPLLLAAITTHPGVYSGNALGALLKRRRAVVTAALTALIDAGKIKKLGSNYLPIPAPE